MNLALRVVGMNPSLGAGYGRGPKYAVDSFVMDIEDATEAQKRARKFGGHLAVSRWKVLKIQESFERRDAFGRVEARVHRYHLECVEGPDLGYECYRYEEELTVFYGHGRTH
jgi:hypothetical protein